MFLSSIKPLACFILWSYWCQTAKLVLCLYVCVCEWFSLCADLYVPVFMSVWLKALKVFLMLLISVNLASNAAEGEKSFGHTEIHAHTQFEGSPCCSVFTPACQFRPNPFNHSSTDSDSLCLCVCVRLHVLIHIQNSSWPFQHFWRSWGFCLCFSLFLHCVHFHVSPFAFVCFSHQIYR